MEGDGEAVTLGKSILVPSVQELAKDCAEDIPERYVRSHDPITQDAQLLNQVPIINLDALICGDAFELDKLHSASQQWGFFQVINHGVNSSLVEKFKLETHEFFRLPFEEKKKYWQTTTNVEGFGQAFVVSEEQKLDWGDMFYMTTFPKHLRKSNLFPKLPLPFRDTLESYLAEMKLLARKILGFMEKALNLESDDKMERKTIFGEEYQSIRMNYYPPCPQPERVMGLTPHTDETILITILLQTAQVNGLHIKHNTNWVPINPLPHAFVVNIGDVLEIMSNGIYKSVMHRAMVNSSKERISIATFHSPGLDKEVGPIPNLVTSTNPARFKRISMVDYWKEFFSRPLDGKKCIDTLRIVDNHPPQN